MSQYAIATQPSQENQQVSEQVALQLLRFVQPLLEVLDAYVDCRFVQTFWQTLVAIIVVRTSLLLSVLGECLADPQHGPAGTKQLRRLLHSAKWSSGPMEHFLWQQAERGLRDLEAGGEEPWCIWDGSVLEKPESQHWEGLAPVRSSKAKRLQRSRPGVFNTPGRPIVVRGWEWTAVLLSGLTGAVQVVSMRWWSRKGEGATTAREQEGQLLRGCARRWGQRVLHRFERGYAGAPWLEELAWSGVRFLMRWPKRYQLLHSQGSQRKAWQIALGKRAWGGPRWLWDGRLRKLLVLVTLVYAFLLSLLAHQHDLLRQWLLERWSHRTGRRARKTRAPLYRLRWALCRLWQRYPPSCRSRSSQPGRPPWSGRLIAWVMWVLVFLNLCPTSSG